MVVLRLIPSHTLMHRFVHNVALSAVLLHIAGGCCWHHAHAEPSACREVAIPDCGGCGHDHHASHEHDPAEPCEHHEHACDTGQCVFVVPETGPSLSVVLDCQWQACLAVDDQAAIGIGAAASCAEAPPPGGRCPPTAIYLIHQILLL